VLLDGLELEGNRSGQTPALSSSQQGGVYTTGARTTVRDCYIHDTANMAISAYGADDLRVERCRIENPATSTGATGYSYKGVYVQGSVRPVIRHTTLRGWSQAIGLWYGVTDGLIEGNIIRDNYGFEDAAHTVNRSACEDYGSNNLHGTNRWIGNVVDGSTHNCFEIAQGVLGSSYLNNVCRNWGRNGTDTASGEAMEVTGQAADGTGYGPTNDILIQGNYIYSDGTRRETGIQVGSYAARCKIQNNSLVNFKGNTEAYPIVVQGDNPALIIGNTFTDSYRAIYINASGVRGGQILNNHVVNGQTSGIAINLSVAGAEWLIAGNSVDYAGPGFGILVEATGGAKHRITGNRVRIGAGGGAGGSAVDVRTADCLIQGNVLENNDPGNTGAINLVGALRAIVRQNVAHSASNRYTVVLLSSADYNLIQDNSLDAASILQSGAGAHNIIEPNHAPTYTAPSTLKTLGSQTVGTSQATIAHGLGYAPTQVVVTMTSAGNIYKSAASDGTNVYLTADASGRTAEVYVR